MTTNLITDHDFDPGDHAWIDEDHLCHDCGKSRFTHAKPALTTAEVQQHDSDLHAENERLRAALTEISDLDLEDDASLADALKIADEALNP